MNKLRHYVRFENVDDYLTLLGNCARDTEVGRIIRAIPLFVPDSFLNMVNADEQTKKSLFNQMKAHPIVFLYGNTSFAERAMTELEDYLSKEDENGPLAVASYKSDVAIEEQFLNFRSCSTRGICHDFRHFDLDEPTHGVTEFGKLAAVSLRFSQEYLEENNETEYSFVLNRTMAWGWKDYHTGEPTKDPRNIVEGDFCAGAKLGDNVVIAKTRIKLLRSPLVLHTDLGSVTLWHSQEEL